MYHNCGQYLSNASKVSRCDILRMNVLSGVTDWHYYEPVWGFEFVTVCLLSIAYHVTTKQVIGQQNKTVQSSPVLSPRIEFGVVKTLPVEY